MLVPLTADLLQHSSQSSSVKSLSVIVSEVSLAGAGDAHERTCASNADVSQVESAQNCSVSPAKPQSSNIVLSQLCLPSQSQVQEAMQAQGNVRKQALTISE